MTSSESKTRTPETSGPSTSKPESFPDASASSITPRKRRENVRDKGARLLTSGRLRVVKVRGNLVVAKCRGDSGGLYDLGYDPIRKQWRCTCEARGPCSHLTALWLVTAVER